VAEYRLPFSFNVVPKLPATQGKRKRTGLDIPTPDTPGLPKNPPAPPAPLPRNVTKPPNQVIVPPRTDGECDPTLTQVNPEYGSTTGGAVIWLAGNDFPVRFPLFARFGTSVVRTVSWFITCEALSNRVSQAFISPSLLSCTLPSAVVPDVVDVTLSKHPQTNAPEYGTSIVKFLYIADQEPRPIRLKTPNQPIAPSWTEGESAPTLTEVNPESGSITGGATIWLKGMDFPALFPLFARFGTAVVPTVSSLITFMKLFLINCLRHSATPTFLPVTCLPQPPQALSMLHSRSIHSQRRQSMGPASQSSTM